MVTDPDCRGGAGAHQSSCARAGELTNAGLASSRLYAEPIEPSIGQCLLGDELNIGPVAHINDVAMRYALKVGSNRGHPPRRPRLTDLLILLPNLGFQHGYLRYLQHFHGPRLAAGCLDDAMGDRRGFPTAGA
jgi:hypothetical protein